MMHPTVRALDDTAKGFFAVLDKTTLYVDDRDSGLYIGAVRRTLGGRFIWRVWERGLKSDTKATREPKLYKQGTANNLHTALYAMRKAWEFKQA